MKERSEYYSTEELATKLRKEKRTVCNILHEMKVKPDSTEKDRGLERNLYLAMRLGQVKTFLKNSPRKPGPKGPWKMK